MLASAASVFLGGGGGGGKKPSLYSIHRKSFIEVYEDRGERCVLHDLYCTPPPLPPPLTRKSECAMPVSGRWPVLPTGRLFGRITQKGIE